MRFIDFLKVQDIVTLFAKLKVADAGSRNRPSQRTFPS
ncbi:hypothetical protein DSUL_20526 [Desulfovibrionales bacterium]